MRSQKAEPICTTASTVNLRSPLLRIPVRARSSRMSLACGAESARASACAWWPQRRRGTEGAACRRWGGRRRRSAGVAVGSASPLGDPVEEAVQLDQPVLYVDPAQRLARVAPVLGRDSRLVDLDYAAVFNLSDTAPGQSDFRRQLGKRMPGHQGWIELPEDPMPEGLLSKSSPIGLWRSRGADVNCSTRAVRCRDGCWTP